MPICSCGTVYTITEGEPDPGMCLDCAVTQGVADETDFEDDEFDEFDFDEEDDR